MSSNENDDPAQIGMRIRGANGQTANLFVVETCGGTDKSVQTKHGPYFAIPAAAVIFGTPLITWLVDKIWGA